MVSVPNFTKQFRIKNKSWHKVTNSFHRKTKLSKKNLKSMIWPSIMIKKLEIKNNNSKNSKNYSQLSIKTISIKRRRTKYLRKNTRFKETNLKIVLPQPIEWINKTASTKTQRSINICKDIQISSLWIVIDWTITFLRFRSNQFTNHKIIL